MCPCRSKAAHPPATCLTPSVALSRKIFVVDATAGTVGGLGDVMTLTGIEQVNIDGGGGHYGDTLTVTSALASDNVVYTPTGSKAGNFQVASSTLGFVFNNIDDVKVNSTYLPPAPPLPSLPAGAALQLDASANASVLNSSGTAATTGQTVCHLEQHRLGSYRLGHAIDRCQSAHLWHAYHQRQKRVVLRRLQRCLVVDQHLRQHRQYRQRVHRDAAHGRRDELWAKHQLHRTQWQHGL